VALSHAQGRTGRADRILVSGCRLHDVEDRLHGSVAVELNVELRDVFEEHGVLCRSRTAGERQTDVPHDSIA